nr:excalibur calcium-binding domain-containing protein [Streptomyces aidingensis]
MAPAAAFAHGEAFENCTAAYEAGYANIAEGDPHYGEHLDADSDGVGCESPPGDFVAAEGDHDSGEEENTGPAGTSEETGPEDSGEDADPTLAETGGGSTAPLLGAGAVGLLAAGGAPALRRRRAGTAGTAAG